MSSGNYGVVISATSVGGGFGDVSDQMELTLEWGETYSFVLYV